MESTLVIQNNVYQIVLTPQNDIEKTILNLINKNEVNQTIKVGNFNDCKGGWIRYFPSFRGFDSDENSIESLMIILKEKEDRSTK